MKITERKPARKNDDFLTTVARSIGSTLGAVAARVNGSARSTRRRPAGRKRTRKHGSVSRSGRRARASESKRSSAAARLTTRNPKKSAN
jgi:hypothetical protein